MAARAFARVAPGRAKTAFYVIAAIGAFLTWRLFDVQIRQGPRLAREALWQHSETVKLYAKRGAIYDRDGTVLVRSLPSESVYCVPSNVINPHATAVALAPLLGTSVTDLEPILRERSQFHWLARKIPYETTRRIKALDLTGIFTEAEDTGVRFTPSGHLASTLLGFVGLDENGLAGLEFSFDAYLRGTVGSMTIEADQFGRAIPFGNTTIVERPAPGRNLGLTIDSYLQFETERALAAEVAASHARSATAIIMDPWTGEILALANVPDYDPARFGSYSDDARRDRAVEDAYEPGSTFKLVTAAAALESGKVTAQTRFAARDELEVGGRTIHNADDGQLASGSGPETMDDIIAHSHNVGAAEIGIAIGKRALYGTIRKFGFGEPTHVELPGENPGIVPDLADWSGSSLATISFGQGISTTPLAMARAYAAIANGGLLMRPRVVRALYDADGSLIYRYGPEIERRVMSARTAATLRGYLRSVVLRGTGNPTARVPGYTSAGKTGTAQMVENGYYAAGAYNASFIGFVPADAPKFVILVKVEKPQGVYYGSTVAAPVFAQLARIAMLHAGVMPAPSPSPSPSHAAMGAEARLVPARGAANPTR
jgi:stage V sporulation protein D (sporulation-specific penicillin-binding protein)